MHRAPPIVVTMGRSRCWLLTALLALGCAGSTTTPAAPVATMPTMQSGPRSDEVDECFELDWPKMALSMLDRAPTEAEQDLAVRVRLTSEREQQSGDWQQERPARVLPFDPAAARSVVCWSRGRWGARGENATASSHSAT